MVFWVVQARLLHADSVELCHLLKLACGWDVLFARLGSFVFFSLLGCPRPEPGPGLVVWWPNGRPAAPLRYKRELQTRTGLAMAGWGFRREEGLKTLFG